MRHLAIIAATLVLSACGSGQDDGVVDVAFIAAPADLASDGVRLAYPGQELKAATAQGLVELDASGAVVPGIAERWIVTDDGLSYIFRIHEFDLPGGQSLTAQSVGDSLRRTLRQLSGTSLGLDLAKIKDVRAMTGRVIEIRLTSQMPDLLQLLAQPELGLAIGKAQLGPMTAKKQDGAIVLTAMPPEDRGLPSQPGWKDSVTSLRVYADTARRATEGFSQNAYDLVLGGRLATLPLANAGALSRGTIRLDATIGLFGLDVRAGKGLLSTPANREALAMAIDRDNLLKAFNIGGWKPTTRIVAPGLAGDSGLVAERWAGRDIGQRQAEARSRIAQWRGGGGEPKVAISLPAGPGSDLLFAALASDFAKIGVRSVRATDPKSADLVLRDRVARYAAPTWFLNQFNCRFSGGVCSADADTLVAQANTTPDPVQEAALLADAEKALLATNLYIPLGAPVRWAQARGDLVGFQENSWGLHPLFPLSRAPI